MKEFCMWNGTVVICNFQEGLLWESGKRRKVCSNQPIMKIWDAKIQKTMKFLKTFIYRVRIDDIPNQIIISSNNVFSIQPS